nr:uncharacterized protein LOC118682007 isoform X2 [Bactrocera oleae]
METAESERQKEGKCTEFVINGAEVNQNNVVCLETRIKQAEASGPLLEEKDVDSEDDNDYEVKAEGSVVFSAPACLYLYNCDGPDSF